MSDEDDFTAFDDADPDLELESGEGEEPDEDEAVGVDALPEEIASRCTGDEPEPTKEQQAETFEDVTEDA